MEGDIFRIVVPLNENTTQSTTQLSFQSALASPIKEIVELMNKEPAISQKEIADQLSLNRNTVKYYVRKLQNDGILKREGTNRKGKWIIK